MSLALEGEVDSPRSFTEAELAALPEQEDVAMRIPGRAGRGVMLSAILAAAKARSTAKWATLVSGDGDFSICVPLDAVARNSLVAFGIPDAKGGPLRFFVIDVAACGTAEVDECANVKRLARIKLTREREDDVGHSHFAKK